MENLINGRTAEEIKAALGFCSEICFGRTDCPYYDGVNERCQTKLTVDALALIERLEAQTPRWISVEERLPEHEHEVLVYTDRYGGRQEFAYYVRHIEARYQNCCLLIPNVTHWMPLPKQPKEDA